MWLFWNILSVLTLALVKCEMILFQLIFLCLSIKNNYEEYEADHFFISGSNEITQNEVIDEIDILNVVELIIGNGIASIGDSAFLKCSNLKNVTLLDSIREIKSSAFSDCSSLKYVTLNEGLEYIEDSVFFNTAIEKIVIPSTVLKISTSYVFHSTLLLSNITVHKDNKYYSNDENNQFLLCKNKTIAYKCVSVPSSLILPSYVEVLWEYFSNGHRLTNMFFLTGSKLKKIQYAAFLQCLISSISFPEGLKEMDGYIFDQSSSISIINLPSTLEIILSTTFSAATTITEINVAPGSRYLKTVDGVLYYNNTKVYFIPPNLTTIVFVEETDSIGGTILQYCTNLSSSHVAFGCKNYISYEGILYSNNTQSFERLLACPHNLRQAKIHRDCTAIEAKAFHTCRIASIVFEGDEITTFNGHSFLACDELTSINKFPSKLETIYGYSFYQCSKLTIIPQFPSSLKMIGIEAFSKTGINSTDLSLCSNLTELSEQAFLQTKISSIVFNDALTSIEMECFKNCIYLESISFGESLERIGSGAFANCNRLAEVKFRCKNLTEIRDGAFSNTGIVSLKIPDSVSSILQRAFSNCVQLKEVIFGDLSELRKLPESMFEGSTISKLRLGSKLEIITKLSLEGAAKLKEIEISDDNKNLKGWKGIVYTKDCQKALICGLGVDSTVLFSETRVIAKEAFSNCKELVHIDINEDSLLEEICEKSFYGCSKLELLRLPKKLKIIGPSSFEGCSLLPNVTFIGNKNSSLTNISDCSFKGCTALGYVELGDAVVSIGLRAFECCIKLISIRLPSSLLSLGAKAFEGSGMQQATFCGLKGVGDETVFEKTKINLIFVPTEYKGKEFCGVSVLHALDGHCCFSTELFSSPNWGCNILDIAMAEVAVAE